MWRSTSITTRPPASSALRRQGQWVAHADQLCRETLSGRLAHAL